MEITYLGHASFCVETNDAVIVTDPWLSSGGAFDHAWFQFPCNHHLASWVQNKLQDSSKHRIIYISHEHRDHLDVTFLEALKCREFTLVIPSFRRAALREILGGYECERLVALQDREILAFPGGELTIYVDDSELNRDSAILIRGDGKAFLNLNDCKLHDALPEIAQKHGAIDAFACQFSGATWHPSCYDYPPEEYRRISRQKRLAKFETVARAIETLRPDYYLPSAGPACFLDPQLFHFNFEADSIFPRSWEFIDFLNQRVGPGPTRWPDLMPGDVVDLDGPGFLARALVRVTSDNHEAYLREYASDRSHLFSRLCKPFTVRELDVLRDRLRECLLDKLAHLPLRDRVPVPLFFAFSDAASPVLRLDFRQQRATICDKITDNSDFYSITAPAWQVARVLDNQLTWEEFALTFRMRLSRSPDLYQALIQAFLILEAEDLNWFCEKMLSLERVRSRIEVEANGTPYRIDRYCPHQGGDLSVGWAERSHWTCPRHRWQFDLERDGRCTTSNCTIHAVSLQPD